MLSDASLTGFIPSTNLRKSKVFYQEVLGLVLEREDDYALEFSSGGSKIRISKVNEKIALPYTILGWTVADIQSSIKDLSEKGIRFEKFAGLNQNETGICTFPDGARVVWFQDPDGNTLSLTQLRRAP